MLGEIGHDGLNRYMKTENMLRHDGNIYRSKACESDILDSSIGDFLYDSTHKSFRRVRKEACIERDIFYTVDRGGYIEPMVFESIDDSLFVLAYDGSDYFIELIFLLSIEVADIKGHDGILVKSGFDL